MIVNPAKTAEPIEMSFGGVNSGGPMEPCIIWGPGTHAKGPVVKYGDILL